MDVLYEVKDGRISLGPTVPTGATPTVGAEVVPVSVFSGLGMSRLTMEELFRARAERDQGPHHHDLVRLPPCHRLIRTRREAGLAAGAWPADGGGAESEEMGAVLLRSFT